MDRRQTIAACIARTALLLETITETPRLEAELLLSHALGVSRAVLLARLHDTVDTSCMEPLLERRLDHEPLAYIFGEWEFFGLPFFVKAPLLVPRPETEHLVEATLNFLARNKGPAKIADLCCGTGCVGIAIAHNTSGAALYASDIRADAVETTCNNAARHGISINCSQGDLFAPLDSLCQCFDVVVSNPPYVPDDEWAELSPVITKHEDPRALLAGKDGLDVIRRIIPAAYDRLRPGGLLALELGESQYQTVAALMKAGRFENITATHDLAGIARIISGIRSI